jgi:hypothetical protein
MNKKDRLSRNGWCAGSDVDRIDLLLNKKLEARKPDDSLGSLAIEMPVEGDDSVSGRDLVRQQDHS